MALPALRRRISAWCNFHQIQSRFFGTLGFSSDKWQELEQAFRVQHLTQEAELGESDRYGQKYRIHAILVGPNSKAAAVVSVWFIPKGSNLPRLVTAYPGDTP